MTTDRLRMSVDITLVYDGDGTLSDLNIFEEEMNLGKCGFKFTIPLRSKDRLVLMINRK